MSNLQTDLQLSLGSFIPLMDPTYDKVRHAPRFATLVRASKWNVDQFTSPHGGRVAIKQ